MKKLYYFINFSFLLLFFSSGLHAQSNEIFISETGNDANEGTIDSPLATIIGARDMARTTGAKTIWIRGGRYSFSTTCKLDATDNGITISGYRDETIVFDGSKVINPESFELVTASALLNKLHSNASGNVKSTIITDDEIIALLSKSAAQISVNDKMKTLARYPNIGYATFNNSSIGTTREIVRNKEKTHIGDYDNPKGGSFQLLETGSDFKKWSAEATRTKRVAVRGYFTAVWLKETNRVFDVSAGDGRVSLVDGSAYGLAHNGVDSKVRRIFIYNMLCELDEPGEWYFDAEDNRLYVWFDSEIDANTKIGVWAGPQCFEINNARDITIKKITIQNIGKGRNGDGAINIDGKSDNILIAGIRFRYIAEPITSVNIWDDVTNSKVLSCDFYDVPNNARLYGGKVTSTSVEYGNNIMENCHFTQIYSKDFYGKACGISGAGNIFRNNLIHNMNGQPVTEKGVEHIIELNESFNTNIEEGDGGVFYTGGSIDSFGNIMRHNFIHHVMSVPEMGGKGAFHLDDLDAGDEVYENVFYKGGWGAVKINNAGGHSIRSNVMVECFTGIRNNSKATKEAYVTAMNFLTTDPTANAKNNYMGRMLKQIGVANWQSDLTTDNWSDKVENFWTERHPRMKILYQGMNDNDSVGPYATDYTDNMFYGSLFRDILSPSNLETISGSQAIPLTIFENPNNLNFEFTKPRPSYAPNIPFQNIGLYSDQYRCDVPNKNIYRQKIKQYFDGQPCHDRNLAYDYKTINDRLYYNTGAMVYATVPCADKEPETSRLTEDSVYEFDLGTPTSPIFKEYIRISNTTAETDFGWLDTTGLEATDKGSDTGVNTLNRDFVTSTVPKIFEANVINGIWKVTVTLGDSNAAHDDMQIKAEGVVKATGIDRGIKEFGNETFNVDVSDGKLTLEFSDEGGIDPNWVVTRIKLVRNKEQETLSISDKQKNTNLIDIYPNVSVNYVNFNLTGKFAKSTLNVQVIDHLGRVILSQQGISNGESILVNQLATGIYFLKIEVENQYIIKRFVKK